MQHSYLNALLLIRALRLEVGLVIVSALHTQEAISGVANPAGQHAVPQHGVDHCAFTITRPEKQTKPSLAECGSKSFTHLITLDVKSQDVIS